MTFNFEFELNEEKQNKLMKEMINEAEIAFENDALTKFVNQLTEGSTGKRFNIDLTKRETGAIQDFLLRKGDITGGDMWNELRNSMINQAKEQN